ncbi:MAG TPA: FCD domain-containing protein [Candidatus Dormibacteraeota bacterium]|jgi:DNA-binding FadR family transcriptional regulator|nr:FCD domain-containing protein [Candidatus Dormibacteraeota bacterium]
MSTRTDAGSGASGQVRETRADRVARELEEHILSEFEVGAALASESELARSMGVSRLTMREATRKLQARGLLEISMGRRPVVAAPSGSQVGDFIRHSLRRDPRRALELLEVREVLEVHIAAEAAAGRGAASLEAMEGAIADQSRAGTDMARFHRADVRFHEALAAASGNGLMAVLVEALARPLLVSRRQSFAGHLERGGSAEDVVRHHRAILDAVRGGDEEAAAAAMRTHLAETRRDLLVTLGGEA